MLKSEAEALAMAAKFPSSVIAQVRHHARHWRENPDAPSVALEMCNNSGCINLRERAVVTARLRAKFAGRLHLAALLKIDAKQAALLLLDGPQNDDQTAMVRAMLDRT